MKNELLYSEYNIKLTKIKLNVLDNKITKMGISSLLIILT
jgi:hypothetical protein